MADVDPDVAVFQIKRATDGLLDLGSVAVICQVDLDRERGCWKAWSDEAPEATVWNDSKWLACLDHFRLRSGAVS